MDEVVCVAPCRCVLGEGPLWDEGRGRLYWFDIKGRRLHWLEPARGRSQERGLAVQVSAAAVRAGGGLLAASERGIEALDPETGALELLEAKEPDLAGFRSNDGKIDPRGVFWWSVMDDDGGRRPGRVYRKAPGAKSRRVLDGIHIPNTISVTADGQTLYLADSALRTLYAYPIEEAGGLGAPAVFATTGAGPGAPDGSALDVDGFVWNAQWGAGRVVRYAPDGRVDRVIQMPVSQPSSCAFGGVELTTLYVTSAREGLDQQALADQPEAGSLFAFEAGVRGLGLPAFAG